ncbi:hypothetical protein KAFR_0F02630 [Kazachstania africana CBS 2517]|uniref:DNA mismatch repair protein S5 domain-containing protein n=1 Tax=Kazachstania africana (strain ATCC 22294 / BCRC 22015 / CBS 2517 / CECT 1963 / NBRC 1671 / NRRL Y-8276) TaxID=1071382 RepID=H2AWW0_KAZAF|nr:hypothetical protein KAFR_0F02630 [Kazachstania africana CBS 2517]CCF58860.1 hypothetical protein KAFR_0F02630 [Kazachstania africana CBS 2517]
MVIKSIAADSKWKIVSSSFIYGPVPAIKELLDNSVDSQAKNIYVDIDSKTGGCEYISVRDDGSGVQPNDRDLMCVSHTTSKISDLGDLSKLTALGFRGDALFMLANLATEKGSLQITTRTSEDAIAEKWFVDKNGALKKNTLGKASSPKGTTVVIKKLLDGLPARKINVCVRTRKNMEELRQLINHYALIYREIRFCLSFVSVNKNGTTANRQLQQSIDTKLSRERVLSSIANLRKPICDNFIKSQDMCVNKYVSVELILPTMHPNSDILNSKKSMKFLSVNKRTMSLQLEFGRMINRILNSIYRKYLLLEPNIWYIDVTCDMKLTDINIEPMKDDILIKDFDLLTEQLTQAIEDFIVSELSLKQSQAATIRLSGKERIRNEVSEIDDVVDVSSDIQRETCGENTTLINDSVSKVYFVSGKQKESSDKRTDDKSLLLRKADRNLTAGTIVSEEDYEWSRNLLNDFAPTSQEGNNNQSSQLPSSLTYNYQDSNDFDDDLILSKDTSLSNPFVLTKMKNTMKHQPTVNFSQKIRQPSSNFDSLVAKKRKMSSPEVNSLDSQERAITEIRNEEEEGNSAKRQRIIEPTRRSVDVRKALAVFSEYTNSHCLVLDYNKPFDLESKKICAREESWVFEKTDQKLEDRGKDVIQFLNEHLRPKSDRPLCMTQTSNGWYIYG